MAFNMLLWKCPLGVPRGDPQPKAPIEQQGISPFLTELRALSPVPVKIRGFSVQSEGCRARICRRACRWKVALIHYGCGDACGREGFEALCRRLFPQADIISTHVYVPDTGQPL